MSAVPTREDIVVKIGGTAGVDLGAICEDVAQLVTAGQSLILVHGGSQEANQLGEVLDYPARFITSASGFTSRYTDRRTLEIFTMAVNGKLNTELVERLQRLGVNALGLSGLDGGLLHAKRKAAIRIVEGGKQKVLRDDFTGKIEAVNTSLLDKLLQEGCIPVVAPLARSHQGETLNVDADRAAAQIAAAMHAATLVLLTAAPGLLRNYPDPNSLIRALPPSELEEAFEYAQGRMKKKVLAAQEALAGEVGKVLIGDGRVEAPLSKALAGAGTSIEGHA